MNPEILHDALTLLPGDLITPVDALRCRPRKTRLHWARWVSLAACLALILYSGFLLQSRFRGKTTDTAMAAAPQAPAAAAPAAGVPEETIAAADAEQNEVAAEEAPAEDSTHSHSYAEASGSTEGSNSGYCGNTMATIYIGGDAYTVSGSDAIAITDILIHLDYDPDKVCPCAAEYTVDTELLTGIELDLTQGFARCEQGQADLTKEQAQTIQTILDTLG